MIQQKAAYFEAFNGQNLPLLALVFAQGSENTKRVVRRHILKRYSIDVSDEDSIDDLSEEDVKTLQTYEIENRERLTRMLAWDSVSSGMPVEDGTKIFQRYFVVGVMFLCFAYIFLLTFDVVEIREKYADNILCFLLGTVMGSIMLDVMGTSNNDKMNSMSQKNLQQFQSQISDYLKDKESTVAPEHACNNYEEPIEEETVEDVYNPDIDEITEEEKK